jgi:hypothetical protein
MYFCHLGTHSNHETSALPLPTANQVVHEAWHSTHEEPLPFTKAGGRTQLGDGRAWR